LLKEVTQQETETKIVKEQVGISIDVSIEMPYKIEKIRSVSHQTRIKKTDTVSVVSLKNQNQTFDCDFVLEIKIEKPFEPRMWVEINEQGSYCGMLSFTPQFQYDQSKKKKF
jgi:hypothetical protein